MKSNEFKSKMVLLGYTQRTLAEKFDVSERTLSRWVNGTDLPVIAILALEALELKGDVL